MLYTQIYKIQNALNLFSYVITLPNLQHNSIKLIINLLKSKNRIIK
jgi:hypothetical protein